jgi:hypothetical protein
MKVIVRDGPGGRIGIWGKLEGDTKTGLKIFWVVSINDLFMNQALNTVSNSAGEF